MINSISATQKRILINIFWLLSEHGVRIVAGIFSVSILARVLGVENYGMFNYIVGLALIFQSLSYINPAELMVPKLTNANALEREALIGNGFFIRLFFSLIAYGSLLLFLAITDGVFQFKLAVILGITILFNETFAIFTAYLQSQTIIKYRSRLVIVIEVINALALILLYYSGYKNIYIYAAVIVIKSILLASCLLLIYRFLTKQWFFSFSFHKSHRLLKQGFPFFIGIVLMIVASRSDVVFMRHLSDEMSLGLYASAVQLFNVVNAISPIIASSCAPLLVYKYQQVLIIKKNVLLLSCAMLSTGVLSALVLYYLAPMMISLVFGERFSGAIHVFHYLLVILPLCFLNEGLNIYLIKMKLAKLMIYKWALVLVGSISTYILFIPKLNSLGAVVGYGVGYLLACLFGLYVIFFYQPKQKAKSCLF